MPKLFEDISKLLDLKSKTNLKENSGIKLGIGIISLLVIILLLPSYKDIDTEHEVGTIWSSEDLIAPFSFPVYRADQDYEEELKEVQKNISPVFLRVLETESGLDELFKKFGDIFSKAEREDGINC